MDAGLTIVWANTDGVHSSLDECVKFPDDTSRISTSSLASLGHHSRCWITHLHISRYYYFIMFIYDAIDTLFRGILDDLESQSIVLDVQSFCQQRGLVVRASEGQAED